jgi:hypothetical protein
LLRHFYYSIITKAFQGVLGIINKERPMGAPYFFYLPCLADAEQGPASALVIGAQSVIVRTVAQCEDLCDTFAAANDSTDTSVKELIACATVFHATWVGAKVPTEAHCSDCYWGVDSCRLVHILTPRDFD